MGRPGPLDSSCPDLGIWMLHRHAQIHTLMLFVLCAIFKLRVPILGGSVEVFRHLDLIWSKRMGALGMV